MTNVQFFKYTIVALDPLTVKKLVLFVARFIPEMLQVPAKVAVQVPEIVTLGVNASAS